MATAAATSQFTGVDFLNFDTLLSEEERAVRDTVRTWVDENLIPVIGEAYIEGRFPKQLIPGMAELGLFGANLPEEYGCAGLNNVAYGLIMQELERGDSGSAPSPRCRARWCMYPIYAFGSDEQKKKWLPLLASGQEIGCFGLTEPDYGSNPGGMITTARETRDGWVLNGTKMWITNGSQATVSIIWAKTGDGGRSQVDPRLHRSHRHPGLRRQGPEGEALAARLDTSEIHLQDVHLPKDAILPKSGGLKSPLMCLTQARYGIAWGAIGAAMACFDEARRVRRQRVMFDKPIARHPDPAGAAGRDADRDHQGAVHDAAARPAQGRRHHDARAGVALQAEQREHGLRHAPGRPAGSSAPTASWPSTTRCATWPTSSRSTPTRAPTTCTR